MAEVPVTIEALAPPERAELLTAYTERHERVRRKTADVFAFRSVRPPLIANDVFFARFGNRRGEIPDAYWDEPELQLVYQERRYLEHVRTVDDDLVPYLVAWFGTGVLASAYGARIAYPPDLDPTADPATYVITGPDDVRRLRLIDPEHDGLLPRVLAFESYMKSEGTLPVSIANSQGPLATAIQLMGLEQLVFLMVDDPPLAHALMSHVTESFITWVKAQKALLGDATTDLLGHQQILVHGQVGIWLCDDDAVTMSPALYREFVVPYNSRILVEFGGGIIHYCGNANHQIDNFLTTEGLRAINNYALANVPAVGMLTQHIDRRLVLFLVDFTPRDYDTYFKQVASLGDQRGTVVVSHYTTGVALVEGGRYATADRDRADTIQVLASMRRAFGREPRPRSIGCRA
jgi:hypothetical protein